ncbi:unnamed protein product [Ectocarpus fasciculatus]
MSAAVSDAPASAASAAAAIAAADVEAPAASLDPTRDHQLRPGGHATSSGDAAAAELATDVDAGNAAASAGGAQPDSTPRPMETSSLPFLAGMAAMMSMIFILGDLMNKRMLHPVSSGVFLLSVSYCVAMLRRQWARAGDTWAGHNNKFTKEAREELITYFVFGTDPEEPPPEAGAGAGAGKEETRQKQQERGNGASSDELQVSRTSSRKWRRESQRSSGDGDDDATVGSASVSGGVGMQNGGIDANNANTGGSVSANTPVPSTGPCSPAPPEDEEVGEGEKAEQDQRGGVRNSPNIRTEPLTCVSVNPSNRCSTRGNVSNGGRGRPGQGTLRLGRMVDGPSVHRVLR